MKYTKKLRLKEMRIAKGFSQQQVADALCMSQSAYARIENEQSRMDTERLFQLADLFEVNVNDELHQAQNAITAELPPPSPSHLISRYEDQIQCLKEEVAFYRTLLKNWLPDS